MFSIMLECNKLPVKGNDKNHTGLNGGELAWNWGCVSDEGRVGDGRWRVEGGRWRGNGILDTCICTHINLLLLSLCQWATFEVRCRQGNKTNTNDKAQAIRERQRE